MIVEFCADCPFMGEAERCQVDVERRDVGFGTETPDWCPLLRTVIVVRHRDYKIPDPDSAKAAAL